MVSIELSVAPNTIPTPALPLKGRETSVTLRQAIHHIVYLLSFYA
jgi:hypothetical protein